jgi:exopolysaccharide biosynthesis polyprenyl glycosylphosphotransferase
VVLWLALALGELLLRGAARRLWRVVTVPERTVLIGTGSLAKATRRKLDLFDDIHLDVVAELESRVADGSPNVAELRRLHHAGGVERVVAACESLDEKLIAELFAFCRSERIKLNVVPPGRAMFGTAARLVRLADLPAITYNTMDPSRSTMLLKRVLDLVLASVLLVLCAPLLVLVALVIRLEDGQPALFLQRRAGRHGAPFTLFKFRTMHVGAEERLAELEELNELAPPIFKVRDDPRVTRVGRVLRRWSIDELPQLVNVLRGDMSLVGPRPEVATIVETYTADQRWALAVRPGITGPMQVYGRGRLHLDERHAIEREYVENLTFARDARLLLLTLPAVLSGNGAF